MSSPRALNTATLLSSGKVLVAGGFLGNITTLASAEVYDPVAGTWTSTANMTTARYGHTATLLPSGRVLVTGGYGSNGGFPPTASAEIYDPVAATWSATGSMSVTRIGHTATLLPSGKVLVAGGLTSSSFPPVVASAELYDPAAGTWSATGSMSVAAVNHTATLLTSGKVLVTGGDGNEFLRLALAQLYDPITGTWSLTGTMNFPRDAHTATLLSSGKVLVAGGFTVVGGGPLATAELYDPVAGMWSATASMSSARAVHSASLTAGKVLVAGGYSGLASAELYDPIGETWSATGSMTLGRYSHTATLLSAGTVLVTGGCSIAGTCGSLASAELYTFAVPVPPRIEVTQSPIPNASGWNNSDVTVTWSLSDPSGIVSSTGCGATTLTQETSGRTLTCSANNAAGLSSSRSVTIKIDKTAPTITFSGNAGTYSVDQTILITCSASDALSGIAATSCPAVASGPATDFVGTTATTSMTLTATATDNADNSASATTTFTVTVDADGICRLTASLTTADAICAQVTSIATAPNDTARAGKLGAFDNFLAAQRGKSIVDDLAALLSRLAHPL